MTDQTANLKLPRILPSQAQKHVTHNDALQVLDAVTQLVVQSRGETTPPAAPEEGACWIVGGGATDTWAAADGQLAVSETGGWRFIAPAHGWAAYIIDEGVAVRFDGSAWNAASNAILGVNASADPANRLTVSSQGTLLTHEGSSHRVKVNKAGEGDTASLVFQSDWSGRAEMGLAGNNDFSLKVSADGSNFVEALRTNSNGSVTFPASVVLADGTTQTELRAGLDRRHSKDGGSTWSDWKPAPMAQTIDVTLAQTASGTWFTDMATWTFPEAFTSAPVVTATVQGATMVAALGAITGTTAEITLSSPTDLSGQTITLHLNASAST